MDGELLPGLSVEWVGAIAGVAAALCCVGGVLAWRVRRQRARDKALRGPTLAVGTPAVPSEEGSAAGDDAAAGADWRSALNAALAPVVLLFGSAPAAAPADGPHVVAIDAPATPAPASAAQQQEGRRGSRTAAIGRSGVPPWMP